MTSAPSPLPLSVFIIARNEEARLGAAIDALRGLTDDLVVVDSGSSDGTVGLAQARGARTFYRDWTGYGAQKRFAEDQCRHPWLLNIDADEVLTEALVREVRGLFAHGAPPPGGYRVRILNLYPGDRAPRPFASDYNVVRLYHRDAGRYRDDPVHDRVVLAPGAPEGQLRAPIHHYSILSWFHMVDKANRFTDHEIAKVAAKPAAILMLRLFTEMPLQFLRNYLLRGHVFGGWKGFVFALNTAFLRTLRIAKALEHREARRVRP